MEIEEIKLNPIKHIKDTFFMCEIFDNLKDDMASMEHPVFSLSTKYLDRVLEYEHKGNTIKIKPSFTGLATIYDKDILMYITSCLMNAKNNGEPISQIVRFTAYDYLLATKKKTSGFHYQQLLEGLYRLNGTMIETNIKTNNKEFINEFGIIDSFGIVKKREDGRMLAVEVKLSDWLYNSILSNSVLTIDQEYFNLRKPTERRLYELARKHCGNQTVWKIKLDSLRTKLGMASELRTLRFNINKIAKTNHLPEYNITLENDVVMFTRKFPPKEPKKTELLPLHVTKQDIAKVANPGEREQQAGERIKKMAEQKGVSTKVAVSIMVADKEAKRKPTTKTKSKPISTSTKSHEIKNLRAALSGKLNDTD